MGIREPVAERAHTFVDHLISIPLRPKTIRDYLRELERIGEWCDSQGLELARLGPQELRAYASTRPNTPGVRSHLRAALIRWWEWQGMAGWPGAIEVPKQAPMVCKAFESDEMEKVAKTARRIGWRPGVAVIAGLGLGVRNEELRTLRWENFDRALEWVTVTGKGNKVRTVNVPEPVAYELTPHRSKGYVFEGRFGGYVSHASINNWVKMVCEEAGFDPADVWPHRMRHSYGAEALDETTDLRAVARAMGHSRTTTTEGYTRTTQAALRRVGTAVGRRLG